jgi:branched-chain amino acid transport system substrate-binding protein
MSASPVRAPGAEETRPRSATPPRLPALLGLALLLALAACEWSGPVRIGFSGPLTGRWSDLGVQGRNGATLAVEELNARGGIAGRRVELLVADERETPDAVVDAVRELDRQGAAVLVGFMTSAAARAGLPAAEKAGLAVVSPTTTSPDFTGREDGLYRVVPDLTAYARALAEHLARRGKTRALVVLDAGNAAFAESYASAFAEGYAACGGQVAVTVRLAAGQAPDGAALARLAADQGAQAVLAILSARDMAKLARELRPAAPGLGLCTALWGYTHEFLEMAGDAAEGVVSAVPYPLDDYTPEVAAFNARYRNRFGSTPSFGAALAYKAVMAAALALGRTGGRRAGMVRALSNLGVIHGVHGDYSFDRFGDLKGPVFLSEIRQGRMATLGTGDD